jgi:hypothetical protein
MRMATSNLTECIDVAFLSRADIRQFLGPPSERARYAILNSCIDELIDKGLVQSGYDMLDIDDCGKFDAIMTATFKSTAVLLQGSEACSDFSGKISRRVPFLALFRRRCCWPSSAKGSKMRKTDILAHPVALMILIKHQAAPKTPRSILMI